MSLLAECVEAGHLVAQYVPDCILNHGDIFSALADPNTYYLLDMAMNGTYSPQTQTQQAQSASQAQAGIPPQLMQYMQMMNQQYMNFFGQMRDGFSSALSQMQNNYENSIMDFQNKIDELKIGRIPEDTVTTIYGNPPDVDFKILTREFKPEVIMPESYGNPLDVELKVGGGRKFSPSITIVGLYGNPLQVAFQTEARIFGTHLPEVYGNPFDVGFATGKRIFNPGLPVPKEVYGTPLEVAFAASSRVFNPEFEIPDMYGNPFDVGFATGKRIFNPGLPVPKEVYGTPLDVGFATSKREFNPEFTAPESYGNPLDVRFESGGRVFDVNLPRTSALPGSCPLEPYGEALSRICKAQVAQHELINLFGQVPNGKLVVKEYFKFKRPETKKNDSLFGKPIGSGEGERYIAGDQRYLSERWWLVNRILEEKNKGKDVPKELNDVLLGWKRGYKPTLFDVFTLSPVKSGSPEVKAEPIGISFEGLDLVSPPLGQFVDTQAFIKVLLENHEELEEFVQEVYSKRLEELTR